MARVKQGQTRRRFAVDEIGKACSTFLSHRCHGDHNSLLSCGNNATVRGRVVNESYTTVRHENVRTLRFIIVLPFYPMPT